MIDSDRLFDRILSLAPLGLVVYALHRHERERMRLLQLVDRDRDAFRDERRELINRVQAPWMVPTGTRPAAPAPAEPMQNDARTATARARAAFASVGHVAPPEPEPPIAAPNGAGE